MSVPVGLEESFDAIIFDCDGPDLGDADADVDGLGQRVEALCNAGLHIFALSEKDGTALDRQLRARPGGPGRLHLCSSHGGEIFEVGEVGRRTPELNRPGVPNDSAIAGTTGPARVVDKSDLARYAAAWLAAAGITGQLILVVGDQFGPTGGVAGVDTLLLVDELSRARAVSVGTEPGGLPPGVVHLGGGLRGFLALLDAQLARRREQRVPQVDADPRWVIRLPQGHDEQRTAEALGTLGNGWAAVRACQEEDGPGSSPLFAVGGVYTEDDRLLAGPNWTALDLSREHGHHTDLRLLDLRTATLGRVRDGRQRFRSLRFVSADRFYALALRAEGLPDRLDPGDPLRPPPGASTFERTLEEGACLARTSSGSREIAMAGRDLVRDQPGCRVVERLAAWATGTTTGNRTATKEAQGRLEEMSSDGFDQMLARHRRAWAGRWADAEVVIEGGADADGDQLAARFAVFHLLAAASDQGEAAVGARGLSGEAYNGHVFWDADVFVLPALAAIRPQAARAMLEYRVRRLPAARAAATAKGLRGARFPWESATDGSDVTPRSVRDAHGRPIRIFTGSHEEHIVADVAWAAHRYSSWTGDTEFLNRGPGRDLLADTARYWASRIRLDADGSGHLYGVMGPDEYHQVVDDNAYTNVMARWNLRQAAHLLAAHPRDAEEIREATRWVALAEHLVDGWNPERGIYEQFAGYFDLEPLLVHQVAQPPVAIDVVLGPDRVAGSQLIKQADVLMLHHLIPDQVADGSLVACLRFYDPRTAHGSSLSPAITASLLARGDMADQALELFRLAARLDLDDVTATTAGGVHLATMGGVWQALAYGFLGLAAHGEDLVVDPRLPTAWSALTLHFRFRGRRMSVRATHERVTVSTDAPLGVRLGGHTRHPCTPPGVTIGLDPVGPADRNIT